MTEEPSDPQPQDPWEYQPAADLNVPAGERVRDVRREAGLIAWLCAGFFRRVAWVYFKLAHRLRVEGRDALGRSEASDGAAVVIANHTSMLDAPALLVSLPKSMRRRAYALAADDTFFRSKPQSVLSATLIGALPMNRESAGRQKLGYLRSRLAAGQCVLVIFPEGTRSRDGQLADFKPGIGMLTAGLDVPLVPASIDGNYRALPPGAKLPRPTRVTVVFGEPMRCDAPNSREGWEEIATCCHTAVKDLIELTERRGEGVRSAVTSSAGDE